jgi:hypothetical protein
MCQALELFVVRPGDGQQKDGLLKSMHLMFNRGSQRQDIARAQIVSEHKR